MKKPTKTAPKGKMADKDSKAVAKAEYGKGKRGKGC